jgi:L-threonylcarbamoyladenylate synthase
MKAKTFQLNPYKPDRAIMSEVCSSLAQGLIVSYPTETFYGLGASIYSESALEKIFAIKGREGGKPLPIIIPDRTSLEELTSNIPDIANVLIKKFWPGGLTLIFRASPRVSPLITGGTGTIGVRISSHPLAQQIVSTLGMPITATSANLSGGKTCSTAQEVYDILSDKIDIIIDGGRTEGLLPSTILDLTQTPPRIVREGIIGEDKIHPHLRETVSHNGA